MIHREEMNEKLGFLFLTEWRIQKWQKENLCSFDKNQNEKDWAWKLSTSEAFQVQES